MQVRDSIEYIRSLDGGPDPDVRRQVAVRKEVRVFLAEPAGTRGSLGQHLVDVAIRGEHDLKHAAPECIQSQDSMLHRSTRSRSSRPSLPHRGGRCAPTLTLCPAKVTGPDIRRIVGGPRAASKPHRPFYWAKASLCVPSCARIFSAS